MDNIFFNISDVKNLGSSTIIGKTVRIRKPDCTTIGDGTIIDDFTYISCGLDVGSYCHIASNVTISGGMAGKKVVIGNYSTISNGSSIHCASSDYRECSLDLPSVSESEAFGGHAADIHIGSYVTIGAHSCILPGSKIPDGVALGAYTMVKSTDKLLPYHLYVGHKCRDLGLRKGVDLYRQHHKKYNEKR